MSFNRDGIVWPVEGGYRYGMFHAEVMSYPTSDERDEVDPEWDVEYNWDRFSYVSPVMPTIEEAFHAYSGPNPGGFDSIEERVEGILAECERYDQMADEYGQRTAAQVRNIRPYRW